MMHLSTGSTAKPANDPIDVTWYVNMWYNEVKDFDSTTVGEFTSNKPPHNGTIGHYTQLVWAGAEKIGCGFIEYQNGAWYKRV